MTRVLVAGVVAVAISGCAGFKSVERGEWRLVYVDSAKRDAEAPREVITRDKYETEVTEGTRRGWEPPPGFRFPLLHEIDRIGLAVGEVQGYRVDETSEAEVLVDGSGVELFWGPMEKKDTWKGDIDVTVRESMLYLKGTKAGPAKLKLVRGPDVREIPVTVK